VSDKTRWEGRDQQLGARIRIVWTLFRALGSAKENICALESLKGYIVSGCWKLKRKFRSEILGSHMEKPEATNRQGESMKNTRTISACFVAAILIALGGLTSTAQDAPPPGGISTQVSSSSLGSNIIPGHNFDGIGQNSFGFSDPFMPPDTAGAVGTTQYIEWVNTSLAVFNKGTGEIVYGPMPGNMIWTSMGGPCATYNDGQPVVQFDKLAKRWVIGQLVLHGPPYYSCIAVSQSDDGTPGNYYLYSIQLNDVPDSPRLGTWPDAYYVTLNMYRGGIFVYANVCGLDRSSMLNGQTPRGPLCQQTSSQNNSLLPADIDGTMPPPSGSPNFLFSLGHNALEAVS